MKNRQAAALLATLLTLAPFSALAMDLGFKGAGAPNANSDGGENCVVWRTYMGFDGNGNTPTGYNGQAICRENEGGGAKRIYELEQAVDQLQKQTAQLQAQLANQQSAPANTVTTYAQTYTSAQQGTDPAVLQRVTTLESRVSILEATIDTITKNVMAALNTTIGLLKKITSK